MFVQAGSSSIVKQTLFNARPMPPIGGSIDFELLNGSPRDCYEVGFVRHYFSGPAIRWLLHCRVYWFGCSSKAQLYAGSFLDSVQMTALAWSPAACPFGFAWP